MSEPGARRGAEKPGASGGDRVVRADAQRNRDAILVSASAAFAERGVGASLEDIARDAGVGSATLHRHFPGRNALIAAVYRDDIEDLCAGVDKFLARSPADEALAEWMCLAVERTMARRGMAAALKAAADGSAEFHDITVTMRSALTRLLTEAATQGLIRGDVTTREMVHALGGFCLFDDQPGAPDRALRLARLLVDGLRHGAPKSSG